MSETPPKTNNRWLPKGDKFSDKDKSSLVIIKGSFKGQYDPNKSKRKR